jgi:hypothetical protein
MPQTLPVTDVARHFAEYSNRVHLLSAVSDGVSALAVYYFWRLTPKRQSVRSER